MVHSVKKLAYGDSAEIAAYVIPDREPVVNIDDYSLVIGDDITAGGKRQFRGDPAGVMPDSTPLTGATITCAAGETARTINPAGTIAALTITLPPTPRDRDEWEGLFSQAVTALTVNAPGGATVGGSGNLQPANSGASWRYSAGYTKWFRRY
jgi:hypothetical protein